MSRPVGADATQTRAKVRQAATRLFAERGVGATSVRAIAQASGVTSATVHHYFGSKDALHRAVVDRMYLDLEDLRGEISEALNEAEGGVDAVLEDAVRRLFRFAVKHDAIVRMLLRRAVETGEIDPDRRRDLHLPLLDELAELLPPASAAAPGRMRLAIQSLMHLVVRYALTTPHELGLVAQTDPGDSRQAVEDHLVDTARRLLRREDLP